MISMAPRAAQFGGPRRTTARRVDPSLRARARSLQADVAALMDLPAEDLEAVGLTGPYVPERFAKLAELCVGRASVWASTSEGSVSSALRLALDLEELALDLEFDALAERNHRLSECGAGLSRLRSIPKTSELLEVACREVVERCGFGRAVVSRVDADAWFPLNAYFAEADDDWFGDFAGQSILLHGSTPEARMLTERLPAVVTDTSRGTMHREIIVEAGQSTSYVVAPILIGGAVVGFVHADHFPERRCSDVVDREVLSTFARGLASTHERLALIERLRAQRACVDDVLGSVVRDASDADALSVMGSGRQLVASRQDVVCDLTSRERDVLSLIVEGATNQEIARRLVIAPDTVKSHVKQILRKFGVTNRAQVIACAAGTAVI